MEALIPLISKVENLAVFVLLLVNGGLVWFLAQDRKEAREERKILVDALNRNTEAVTQLRIHVAAATGRTQ